MPGPRDRRGRWPGRGAAVHAALPNSRVVVTPGQQHVAMSAAPELFIHPVLHLISFCAPFPPYSRTHLTVQGKKVYV